MKKVLSGLCIVVFSLVLGACGSSVKLNDVPVEDRSTSASGDANAANGNSNATGTGTGQSTVAGVDLNKNNNKGSSADDAASMSGRIVYFDFDSYVVQPAYQSVIEAQAKYLRADAKRKVVLQGHTDERGGREYNLALGQKRAEAVRSALGVLGVADAQMESVSFGKEKPAVQGGTEEAMAKNRRVEFSYR